MMLFQRKTAAFNIALALGLAAATTAFVPSAQAKAKKRVRENRTAIARKAIADCYARYNEAMKKGDVDTQMTFIGADYEHYTIGGVRQDRETFERTNRNMWNMGLPIHIGQLETKIKSFQWRGPDAVLMVNTHIVTGMYTKRTKPIDATTLERHYWSPSPTGWKLRQVVEVQADASDPFRQE